MNNREGAKPSDFSTIRDAARFVLLDGWEAIDSEGLADGLAASIERWSADVIRKAREAAEAERDALRAAYNAAERSIDNMHVQLGHEKTRAEAAERKVARAINMVPGSRMPYYDAEGNYLGECVLVTDLTAALADKEGK